MEIKTIDAFLTYYERTRQITHNVIAVIPPDKTDWTYMPGKFTIGDLLRHLAAIERYAFAEAVKMRPISYTGYGKELADGFENIVAYFDEMHRQSMEIFSSLKDEDLTKKIHALNGREIDMGSFLRALVVHEIHHRGALCIYLNMLGIKTPPVLGLNEEQVREIGIANKKK